MKIQNKSPKGKFAPEAFWVLVVVCGMVVFWVVATGTALLLTTPH